MEAALLLYCRGKWLWLLPQKFQVASLSPAIWLLCWSAFWACHRSDLTHWPGTQRVPVSLETQAHLRPQVTRSQGPSHLLVIRSLTHTFPQGKVTGLSDRKERKCLKKFGMSESEGTVRWLMVYKAFCNLLCRDSSIIPAFCFGKTCFKVPWACSIIAWLMGEWGILNLWFTLHSCRNCFVLA